MNKLAIIGLLLLCGTLTWSHPSSGEPASAPRGELHVVDRHPNNWAFAVLNVFEHLIDYDKNGGLEPRLATGWRWLDDRTLEFILRQGVRFHNGEVFNADIVKLNWEENTRLKQPFSSGSYMNFKPGSRLEIIDPYTIRFVFPATDGGALARLSTLHIGNRQFHRELGGWGEKGW